MLQKSIHENLNDDEIMSWIIDLSESSDIIKNLSKECFEQIVWQKRVKNIIQDILEELVAWVNIKREEYNKPIASMIFAGPSWVWKTLVAKIFQKILNKHFDNDLELLKINCADFAWDNYYWLTRLIWASAWFIWSDKKPVLHPSNVEWKWRVILFDEIEKAWPWLWNILLSVLDDWILDVNYTEKSNTNFQWIAETHSKTSNNSSENSDFSTLKTFFSESVVIMTSNVWNELIEKEVSWSSIWFTSWKVDKEQINIEEIILKEFEKQFRIEMQWRFDYIVPFQHLTRQDLSEIINQLINRLIINTLSNWNGFIIEFSNSAKEKILDDILSSNDFRKYWWRYVEWYFNKNIVTKVAKSINSWKLRDTHNCLLVTTLNWEIVFSKVPIWWTIINIKNKVTNLVSV